MGNEIVDELLGPREGAAEDGRIIAELRRAEKEREEYRNFFETSTDLMCIADPNGAFKKVNPAFTQTLGFSESELLSKSFIEFVHPDDRQRTVDEMADQLRRGFSLDFENRYACKDGTFRWLSWRAYVNEAEGLTYATARDVTARKIADEEVRVLNHDFVTLLESTSDFIYFKDKDSRIRFCSQAMASLCGHATWRDLIGKHDLEIFPPETARIYQEEELPVFRDGVPLLDKIDPYFDREGNRRWVSTNKWPVFGDDHRTVVGIFGISRDISERKRLEEMLRAREEKVENILIGAPVGIAVLVDRALSVVNDVFCETTGYSREELLGASTRVLYLSDEEYERTGAKFYAAGKEKPAPAAEARFRRKDGRVIDVLLTMTAMDRSNPRAEATFMVMDITERKRAERTSREVNQQLERAKEEATRLYEKSKELDLVKSRFFASVSHELRTPLALILGPTQRMLASPDTSEASRRDLEVVARNARTLHRHVDDLLDVAKLEAGRMKLDYAETDLSRLARFVASHFDVLANERGITCAIETPETLWAEVDVEKLQRILLNLLSNAFKFTPAGGRVRLRLDRPKDDRVLVEVADSGPGIPEDKREAAFERFLQLEGGDTRPFGGTGLGLSIARELAVLHDGSIAIGDAPEGGALFTVEMPRMAPPGAPVRPRAESRLEARGRDEVNRALEELSDPPAPPALAGTVQEGPLVLVVEDNPEMNRFIAESLSDRYRVATAFDGKEGLDKAVALKPDLVLTDIMMPAMSGDELVTALRERTELSTMPIVLLSAKADDEVRVSLLREGAQDYLTKPFAVEELRARVENLVAAKLSHDAVLASEARLRTLHEALERAVRARDKVLAIVAHDLRNPLNAIVLQSRTLRRRGPEPERRDQEGPDRIFRAAMRMNRLIQDLLDVARLEAGQSLSLTRDAVSTEEVLAEAIERQRATASESGRKLGVDTEGGTPSVWADRARLLQVFDNLLGNAIKFSREQIRVGTALKEDGVHFWVTDDGAGVAAEDIPHLFDHFWQVREDRRGAGLGLWIVKEIVDAHGGRLWVESEVGVGTTFTFTLPVAPRAEAQQPRPEALA